MASQTTTWDLQRVIRDQTPPFANANDRYVFIELLQYASPPRFECWAGQERLALRMQLSVRTIRRSISNLEKDGWISVIRRRGESNKHSIRVDKILAYAKEVSSGAHTFPKTDSSPANSTNQPQPAAYRRKRAVVYSEAKGTP